MHILIQYYLGEEKILAGFYKGKKISAELVKDRREKETPWAEVVDESEKLLEVHLTVNVRS